jgi:hypothetical protein
VQGPAVGRQSELHIPYQVLAGEVFAPGLSVHLHLPHVGHECRRKPDETVLCSRLSRSGESLRLDPRIPAAAQTGEQAYAGNDLDRGHIAWRSDLLWSTLPEARKANSDSYHFTNIRHVVSLGHCLPSRTLAVPTHTLDHHA